MSTISESIVKISDSLNNSYTPEQILVIQNTVAKGTTTTELSLFLYTAKEHGLSALKKEIWCYKDKKKNLLMFCGRDGFLSLAQRNPIYNGLRSVEVCKNDNISIDIPNGKIDHVYSPTEDRGPIIGAYCFVFRKNGESTIEYADIKTYDKGYNTWQTHKSAMIKKVAETNALKKAFGMSGLQSEYEFEVQENVVQPISHEEIDETDITTAKLELLKLIKGSKNSSELLLECKSAEESGNLDLDFISEIKTKIQKNEN